MGEAEELFSQRGADPELRQLYRDLASRVLTVSYFRKIRDYSRPKQEAKAKTKQSVQQTQTETVEPEPAPAAAGATGSRRVDKTNETAAYILAESANSEEGWENFIKQFPASQLAVIAQTRLELVRKVNRVQENKLYAAALQAESPEAWDQYIQGFPDGRFVQEAMRKRTEAVQRIEHEKLYKAARDADTVDGWRAYLDRYPQHANSAGATQRIDQLDWLGLADLQSIPEGSFIMGSRKGNGSEKPPHRVELGAFKMGRTEVTNALYAQFLEDARHRKPKAPSFSKKNYMGAHPELPVINVTYADALTFCKWLSKKTGATVRLPTEAEWEYAARSGHDNYNYAWGPEKQNPKDLVRYGGNDPSGVKTVARESYPSNEFGLYNMAGNVAEWVSDYYSDKYYKSSPARSPQGTSAGKERVIRGGSWRTGDDELKIWRRFRAKPDKANDSLGFRIVVQ